MEDEGLKHDRLNDRVGDLQFESVSFLLTRPILFLPLFTPTNRPHTWTIREKTVILPTWTRSLMALVTPSSAIKGTSHLSVLIGGRFPSASPLPSTAVR